MLELDFTPTPRRERGDSTKNLIIGILAILLAGVTLLYVMQFVRAKKETKPQRVTTLVPKPKVVVKEIDPRKFLLRAIVGREGETYIILEGSKGKFYLIKSGDIVGNWEINYAGGDSVRVKSLETGESFYLSMGG